MSSAASRAAQIRLEEQLRSCLDRIAQLEARVAVLETDKESAFELVSEFVPPPSVEPTSSSATSGGRTGSSRLQEEDRQVVLCHIGDWIKACLAGRRRGLSGRERLTGGNSCYLVFRNFAGECFNPVAVYSHFGDLAREVKPSGYPGDSIFIGLPSIEDARIVAAAAGCEWPQ